MSKVKKVVIKKQSDSRSGTHYINTSTLPQTNPTKYLPERSELYSESPYNSKLLRTRSISNLKDNPSKAASGTTPTPIELSKKSQKSTCSLNSSIFHIKDFPRAVSCKKPQNLLETESQEIEAKIEELVKVHKENGIDFEIFQKYEQYFDDIIKKDKFFGNSLMKIKLAYNDWITSKVSLSREVKKLKSEVFEFTKKLTEEIEENKHLHRKVQKFSRENVDLGRALDEKDTNFKALQEYLLKITNMTIDEIPQDIDSWKVLVSENKSYSDLCTKLKSKVKEMKQKEKKLMNLFWMMKQKGFPVEKMYEKLDRKTLQTESNDQAERMTRRSSKGSSLDLNRVRNSSNEEIEFL